MLDPATSLALAERVSVTAKQLGFDSALIGAAALAVHRYTRGTEDIDPAVALDPDRDLMEIARTLTAGGLETRLRLPDDEDPLGGVLTVWASIDEDGQPVDVVDVVNFHNPRRIANTPARNAIARAQALPGSPLRCVAIEDLIALTLYAGGLIDHADVVELLARNPDADLQTIRTVAAPFDSGGQLESLIEQAAILARRRR